MTTGLVMLSMLAVPAYVYAQNTGASADVAPGAQTTGADNTVIVVTGVRASQQSAIDRKKKAKTATDSIVAEDVGQFPDKNIGEAISRIAGVALNRGNFNEGEEVTLRGVSSGQTNVELDGLGVQNSSIANNLAFGGNTNDGRSKDFRDLPADLIKSVDVVKGSTAAMGEGGLGGSIIIQTRNGLDFKKPFFSLSYEVSRNSLGKKLTPTVNVIASRKFFNNKLGVILNYSYGQTQNDGDQITQGGSNNIQGLAATVDFDNSPNKTFSFNPATVTGPDASTVLVNSSNANGTTPGGTGITPLQLATISANAKTKADCYAAFPKLTGAPSAVQNAERSNELITCLNQWNDYQPGSNIRYIVNRDTAQLTTLNMRFDYKVYNDLQVYFAITDTHRKVDNNFLFYQPGGILINQSSNNFATGGSTFTDTATAADPVYGSHRVANTAATGYYAYAGPFVSNNLVTDNSVTNVVNDSTLKVDANHHVISATITDGTEQTNTLHNTNDFHSYYLQAGGQYRHGPWAVDFVFGDATSHYTRYDQRIGYSFTYGPALMTLASGSGLWSVNPATAFNQADPAVYAVLKPPTGSVAPKYIGCTFPNETAAQAAIINPTTTPATPACTTPTSVSPGQIYNAAGATPVPGTAVAGVVGYTNAQLPWVSNSLTLNWDPKITLQETQTAKIDVTYNFSDKMPFFTDIKAGVQLKKDSQKAWAGGGGTISPQQGILGFPNGSTCASNSTTASTPSCLGALPYKAAVVIPTNGLRTTVRACDATRYGSTGSAAPAGALSCQYGFINSTAAGAGPNTAADALNVNYGQLTLTQADFQALISKTLSPAWYRFFDGFPDRGSLFEGWSQIDVQPIYDAAIAAGAATHYNFDCMVKCKGSDGLIHYQPFNSFNEFSNSGYFMVEFEQDLPFGVRFNGNAGTRYVKTDTRANGFFTLNSIRCNNPADCNTNTTTANTTTFTATQSASFTGHTTDWTPSYNYNLWFWDDKIVARYYWGKAIARPAATKLLPAGTCNTDQRLDTSGGNESCSSVGNPNLSPFKSTNQNWSLEFYPNKDTQFSYATFKNNIKVNNPINCSKTAKLFAGSSIIDPFTGQPIANQTFAYTTFCDGPGFIRRGDEYAVKSAFTFLPWYFKYLGFDGNYATLHSSTTVGGVHDPITGTTLPPVNEPGYYYNASFWYDDGATNVRIAYQARDQVFSCIESCGVSGNISRNTPNADGFYTNIGVPYSPGYPLFTQKTNYLDAKITHKWKGGVEGYISIKNALEETTTSYQDKFGALADGTPVVLVLNYPGSRIDFGITIRR
jgi:TonB-dependent receptor